MQRHGARHAQASLTAWMETYLDALGEQNYTISENLGESELAGKSPKAAGLSREIWVTVGERDVDQYTGLGGGPRETRYWAVIDILGAPSSACKALAEDVFELLTGMTSAGDYVPFYNQATGELVEDELLYLEAASLEQATPARTDWWQAGCQLWRSYLPG